MKNYKSTVYLAVVFVFISGLNACRPQRQASSIYNQTCFPVISAMADSVYCTPNTDSTYYLCQNKKFLKAHALYPHRLNRIMIIKCNDGDIIFNEEIPGGTARWFDAYHVDIFSPSGIPRNGRETTFHLNVRSKKKTYLDSNIE